jgi:hypothetical protein
MTTATRRSWARSALPIPQLDALVADALAHTIDKSTSQSYDSHLTSYITFCELHRLPITPTTSTLSRYIAFMSTHISPNSLDTYLSGITFKLRPHFPEIVGVRNSPYIHSVMKGMKRLHGTPTRRKEPISFNQLNVLAVHYSSHPSYDNSLFLALILTGFFGLLRLGEITDPNDRRLVNRRKTIRQDSLHSSTTQFSFILPASKTDKFFAGNKVLIRNNSCDNNPIRAFGEYVRARDAHFPHIPWLWITSDGAVPTRRWFLHRFHLHFDSRFGGHSMRAGGATLLAKHGVPFDVIQALGRWSSDAFRIYIRTHPALLHANVGDSARNSGDTLNLIPASD